VAARFEEAVRLAEQAFASELADLVDHLAERLSPGADGRPKVFRDSAIANFSEFVPLVDAEIAKDGKVNVLARRRLADASDDFPEKIRNQSWPAACRGCASALPWDFITADAD